MTDPTASPTTIDSDQSAKIAFVFCVESGWLEAQARLLVASIRRFAGRFATVPIYAVQPRGESALAQETYDSFTAAGVIHRAGSWNRAHHDIPTCNKVYAVALIEREAVKSLPILTPPDTEPMPLITRAYRVFQGGHLSRET